MSQQYVPGPVQIFAGVGAAKAMVFLGYAEGGVNVRFDAMTRPVYADYAGPEMIADEQWMGEVAFTDCTLNRYTESALTKLIGRRVASTVVPGQTEANAIGSLMIAQGYYHGLVLQCPYGTVSFQNGTIVPGYYFPTTWVKEQVMIPMSAEVKRPHLVFFSMTKVDPVALTGVLYTSDTTAWPTLPSIT